MGHDCREKEKCSKRQANLGDICARIVRIHCLNEDVYGDDRRLLNYALSTRSTNTSQIKLWPASLIKKFRLIISPV